MKIKWTKNGLAGLASIAEFIALDNPNRAVLLVQEIKEKVLALQQFPALGRAGVITETRELVVHKNYVVIYRIKGQEIHILRTHSVKQLEV